MRIINACSARQSCNADVQLLPDAKKQSSPLQSETLSYGDIAQYQNRIQGSPIAKKIGKLDMKDLIIDLFGFEPETPGQISIEELERHGKKQLLDFHKKMQRVFRNAGVDTSIPIELDNEYGTVNVIVINDHTDKEKIEAIFKNNFEFRNDQVRIDSMLSLAVRGKESALFHQAYKLNSNQALADFSYLWQKKLKSTISFFQDHPSISFSWEAERYV